MEGEGADSASGAPSHAPDDVPDDVSGRVWVRHRWPHEKETARTARHWLKAALGKAGTDQRTAGDAMLVLAELVSNAIQHGTADADGLIEVSWCLEPDRILVSVHDGGHVEALTPGDLSAVTDAGSSAGRGLALVDLVSDRWCWSSSDGTFVAAELRFP
jgi:anti-sigma regulatory factor (Ser/Thr protein kinase)